MEYYKVYMQKEREGAPTIETIGKWGLYCSAFAFNEHTEGKDLAKRDWHDEDGDDVFYPDTLAVKSGECEVEFSFKGDKFAANEAIEGFRNWLLGKDGYGIVFRIYCDYNRLGWGSVRLKSISDDATLVRDADGDILVFKVKFCLDNPSDKTVWTGTGWQSI